MTLALKVFSPVNKMWSSALKFHLMRHAWLQVVHLSVGKKEVKKTHSAAQLASILATRCTGNRIFFMDSPIRSVNLRLTEITVVYPLKQKQKMILAF